MELRQLPVSVGILLRVLTFVINKHKMGSMTLMLSVFAMAFVISYSGAAGSGSCPLPSKVYGCSPKCQQNYDCSHGKVCCPNSCNAKSCTEAAPYGSAANDKHSQSGAGIYCANVKCNAFEVCKTDPSTKRQKCARP